MTDKEQADKFLKIKCFYCKWFKSDISHAMCDYHIIATFIDLPNHRHCNRDCEKYKSPSAVALREARKVKANGKRNEIYSAERTRLRIERLTRGKAERNETIRKKLNAGKSYKEVAREHGLAVTTLYNIKRGV